MKEIQRKIKELRAEYGRIKILNADMNFVKLQMCHDRNIVTLEKNGKETCDCHDDKPCAHILAGRTYCSWYHKGTITGNEDNYVGNG